MQTKIKTKYQTKNGQLFYEGKSTEILVNDDYFFLGNKPLNIYQEDGQIFVLKPLVPLLNWPMISSSTGLSIDEDGFLWAQNQSCIFDDYIKAT